MSAQSRNGGELTAAMLLIGNELLSGRTRDANLSFVGSRLSAHGVRLVEARIVQDNEEAIVAAVNALRTRYRYVFTSGGIGPTHDDITADCIARAFDVAIAEHPEAKRRLLAYWAERAMQPNPARLRMARIPDGASLIDNDISAAPGFRLDNVFVLAGVPSILQNMFEHLLPSLDRGLPLQSVNVVCPVGEGRVAGPLAELQQRFDDVEFGSYPGDGLTAEALRGTEGGAGRQPVVLVARSTDPARLENARQALEELVRGLTAPAEPEA